MSCSMSHLVTSKFPILSHAMPRTCVTKVGTSNWFGSIADPVLDSTVRLRIKGNQKSVNRKACMPAVIARVSRFSLQNAVISFGFAENARVR